MSLKKVKGHWGMPKRIHFTPGEEKGFVEMHYESPINKDKHVAVFPKDLAVEKPERIFTHEFEEGDVSDLIERETGSSGKKMDLFYEGINIPARPEHIAAAVSTGEMVNDIEVSPEASELLTFRSEGLRERFPEYAPTVGRFNDVLNEIRNTKDSSKRDDLIAEAQAILNVLIEEKDFPMSVLNGMAEEYANSLLY